MIITVMRLLHRRELILIKASEKKIEFTNEHLLSSWSEVHHELYPLILTRMLTKYSIPRKSFISCAHDRIEIQFRFKTKQSNKNVYTIVCVDENCKWRLHATKFKYSDYFQISKYAPEHTCALNLSTNDHRQARSWIIGKHIVSRFEDCNTTYRPADVANEIRRDFGIEINYQKARRSRETALAYIRGSPEDSYTKLAAWAHNLKVANPGTIYSLEVDSENRVKYKGALIIATCQDANMRFILLHGPLLILKRCFVALVFMNLKGITGDQEYLVVISDDIQTRQTPILALFDSIGKKLRSWFYERREVARSCTGNLTPAMEEKLRKSHEKAKKFTVEPIDQSLYVVRSGATNFTVNFAENTCTCRKFQLDHLPCEHAIAVAKKRGFSIYPMCSPYYSVDYWWKAYMETIFPVPNENEWEIPDNIKEMIVLPPIVGQQGGRRRTVRIPSTGEFRSRQKCSRCQQLGHNRLNCRDQRPMSDRQSHL
ncbi:hypothetical protein DH2020_029519 [Rehmannia glutinosa]|uniref:SWIM-type domain-containing protein n=1 Tax=Rehmannia glutinosa TaxID=99300 RepID=A0ABR0VR63_REHGL